MDALTDEVMTKIERLPAVTEKDLDALHDFSQEVNSMISLIEAVGQPTKSAAPCYFTACCRNCQSRVNWNSDDTALPEGSALR